MINENSFNNINVVDEEKNTELELCIDDCVIVLKNNGWQVIECGDNFIFAKPNLENITYQCLFNVKKIPNGGFVDDTLTLRYPVESGYLVEWFDVNGKIIGVYYSDDTNSFREFTKILREESIDVLHK